MRDSHEVSLEEQAFTERILDNARATRRERQIRKNVLIGLAILVALGLLAALQVDALREAAVLLMLSVGPVTCVLAAKTTSGRAVASALVAALSLGWWIVLGQFEWASGSQVPGIGMIPACMAAPMAILMVGCTVFGIVKLYREAD